MDDEIEATRILGRLQVVDGEGVVRVTDRHATDARTVWSALTDRDRLARWLGAVDGELRVGAELRLHFSASGWDGTARVEVCTPPRRLRVLTRELDSDDRHVVEVALSPDGAGTTLVVEERGAPPEQLAAYGAGLQIHVEDLAAHLAGRNRCDARTRFEQLFPAYQALAGEVR